MDSYGERMIAIDDEYNIPWYNRDRDHPVRITLHFQVSEEGHGRGGGHGYGLQDLGFMRWDKSKFPSLAFSA